jgi:hypothetical protein
LAFCFLAHWRYSTRKESKKANKTVDPDAARLSMKHFFKATLFGFLTAIISACSTTYKAGSFAGGFSETQLYKNVWRVTFRGSAISSPDQVEELALLRSADLTLSTGYKFFALAAKRPVFGSVTNVPMTPESFEPNSSIDQKVSFFGNSVVNTVVMFKQKPVIQETFYDATLICNALGSKHDAGCATESTRSSDIIQAPVSGGASSEDPCGIYVIAGEYCWWSPPGKGNSRICPVTPTLAECSGYYGDGCRIGHGKVPPNCN